MDVVVVVHPKRDRGEGGLGIRDCVDPDVVALEGFDEGFGDAVAFRTFDRGEQASRLSAVAISIVLPAA